MESYAREVAVRNFNVIGEKNTLNMSLSKKAFFSIFEWATNKLSLSSVTCATEYNIITNATDAATILADQRSKMQKNK